MWYQCCLTKGARCRALLHPAPLGKEAELLDGKQTGATEGKCCRTLEDLCIAGVSKVLGIERGLCFRP